MSIGELLHMSRKIDELERERDEARAELKKLKEAVAAAVAHLERSDVYPDKPPHVTATSAMLRSALAEFDKVNGEQTKERNK